MTDAINKYDYLSDISLKDVADKYETENILIGSTAYNMTWERYLMTASLHLNCRHTIYRPHLLKMVKDKELNGEVLENILNILIEDDIESEILAIEIIAALVNML